MLHRRATTPHGTLIVRQFDPNVWLDDQGYGWVEIEGVATRLPERLSFTPMPEDYFDRRNQRIKGES